MATKLYGSLGNAIFNKEVNWASDTIKVMLVSSSYTPNQDVHDYVDDVRANEVSGAGYTAGGQALATKTHTYDASTNTHKFDAADVTWSSSSITARYAVVYDDSGASDATKALVGYYDFGVDKASSNGDFIVRWGVDGLFTVIVA